MHLSGTTIALLLWQGVAVVGVSCALWFWTLTNYAAAQLWAFTFITRLVGVFAGWLVFGEKGHGPPLRWRSSSCSRGLRSSTGRVERAFQPAREVLNELPGDAAGA